MRREGYVFIPENRRWDSDEREWISKAIGLHQLSPSAWSYDAPDRWWKAVATTYAETRDLNLALLNAIGEIDEK